MVCPAVDGAANGLELLICAVRAHDIEPFHAHSIGRVAAKVVANHNNKIREHKDATLKIVALSFAVDVAQEEHAQNHRHHVPLREKQRECVHSNVAGVGVGRDLRVDG